MKKLVFTALAILAVSGVSMAKSKKTKMIISDCASEILQRIEEDEGCLETEEYNALYEYYSQDGMCG